VAGQSRMVGGIHSHDFGILRALRSLRSFGVCPNGPQQRQADGVISAHAYAARLRIQQRRDSRFDAPEGIVNRKGIHGQIAEIGGAVLGNGLTFSMGFHGRMIAGWERTCPGPNRGPGR
jgi:hypothetical protein